VRALSGQTASPKGRRRGRTRWASTGADVPRIRRGAACGEARRLHPSVAINGGGAPKVQPIDRPRLTLVTVGDHPSFSEALAERLGGEPDLEVLASFSARMRALPSSPERGPPSFCSITCWRRGDSSRRPSRCLDRQIDGPARHHPIADLHSQRVGDARAKASSQSESNPAPVRTRPGEMRQQRRIARRAGIRTTRDCLAKDMS
jgi:hypothetical protein